MEEIAKRIRERRIELRMSQEELALKVGYKSRQSIQSIECGRVFVQSEKIKDFARALCVSEEWLMGCDPMQYDNDYEMEKIILRSDKKHLLKYMKMLMAALEDKE